MKRTQEVDIVDVHVTSTSERVDAFTQYPLLDGTKKYTVEVTEFVCPLAGQEALPNQTTSVDNLLFEIRRRYVVPGAGAIPVLNDMSRLVTSIPMLANNQFLPFGLFTDDKVQFRKNDQRPMATPGDMCYHLQRFFDDVIRRYLKVQAVAAANLLVQTTIANDPASAPAEVQAANELINGPTVDGVVANNGLQSISDAYNNPLLLGALHGGIPNILVTAATKFVTVNIQPNGCLALFFHPVFTKHFFLEMTTYGERLLGIGVDHLVAFRDVGGYVATGLHALTSHNVAGTIIAGGADETVENRGTHPLERYFDHRIRLEVESQIGIPPTVVWSTDDRQKISHNICTFPIQMKTQSAVLCNSEGAATAEVSLESDLLVGDITWRRAEDKVSERYLIHNSQYFHNVRLEIFIVRKQWFENEFRFIRERMTFTDGESWTAKLRFRSIT